MSGQSKKLKAAESKVTDQRIKMINDIVIGIRTIKCFGLENHYLKKIKQIRDS